MSADSLIEGKSPKEVLEFAQIIKRNTETMLALVTDLLEVERISVGQVEMHYKMTELPEVIDLAIASCAVLAKKKEILVTVDCPSHFSFSFDKYRIGQLLSNLINNAVKFTDPGGQVKIGALEEGDHIRVYVKDNGIGIAPADRLKIFDRYAQVKRDGRGIGLGLYISKWIVEAHNGKIWVDSQEGVGTTFHCTLPRRSAAT